MMASLTLQVQLDIPVLVETDPHRWCSSGWYHRHQRGRHHCDHHHQHIHHIHHHHHHIHHHHPSSHLRPRSDVSVAKVWRGRLRLEEGCDFFTQEGFYKWRKLLRFEEHRCDWSRYLPLLLQNYCDSWKISAISLSLGPPGQSLSHLGLLVSLLPIITWTVWTAWWHWGRERRRGDEQLWSRSRSQSLFFSLPLPSSSLLSLSHVF